MSAALSSESSSSAAAASSSSSSSMSSVDRMNIYSDLFSFASSSQVSLSYTLHYLSSHARHEKSPYVWFIVNNELSHIYKRVYHALNKKQLSLLHNYFVKLYTPIVQYVGWTINDNLHSDNNN